MTSAKRNRTNSNNFVKFAAIFAVMSVFVACGGNSGSSAKPDDDGREVGTVADMGRCTSEREGDTVYVAEKMTDYLCKNRSWVDLTTIPDNEKSISSSSAAKGTSSSSSIAPNSVSGTSSGKDVEPTQGLIRENISVTGVAQKGPFKFGSSLNLYELKKDLTPSGRVYKDEISSNKGDFVIPKVSLAYPYAKLEVRGLYRNEVTGEWSNDSMTLRALTDFSEKRTEVNINLLTHLEYDRVLYLVQEKGYSVYAAKKQAAQEIMTAFEFATAVTCSEDFAIFQNEGVSAAASSGNATLLAVSALVMGNRSDAEIQSVIDKFREDIRTDGEWNDLQTKTAMADWAYVFDYSSIRASVKNWNILDIPAYETYLDVFWNNAYGLGGCSVNRKDIVVSNSNKLSKYYNKYFICKLDGSKYSWADATTYQKDTYEWATGKIGEFKKGNVTDSIYVYDGSKWSFSPRETSIGVCGKSNAGVVKIFDGIYYICKNNAWEKATMLEYDTYGWKAGSEGSVKAGSVNSDKYYVYENGTWRASTGEIENSLGACVTSREDEIGLSGNTYYICKSKAWTTATSVEKTLGGCTANREGEVSKSGNIYYICKSKKWTTATPLEYDTYGWKAGVEGDIKVGVVNTSNYYIYKNGQWQVATSVEKNLGGCTANREGKVSELGEVYYICKSKNWRTATALEYDTYDKICLTDGSIIAGNIVSSNKYVCDAGTFRSAKKLEISLDKGCVSYTEGTEIRKHFPKAQDSIYLCNRSLWKGSKDYGSLTDSRDGKTYKTVVIGSQTWMAENLNYSDSATYLGLKGRSWCYKNSVDSCAKYGRYYTWAAAMDSVGTFSSAGKGCGYKKICSPEYPVRGICPEGWHLPANGEWNTLYSVMDSSPYVMQAEGYEKWPNASDAYGFSAIPVGVSHSGYSSLVGFYAYFWSATGRNDDDAYIWNLSANVADLDYGAVFNGFTVRCVKD